MWPGAVLVGREIVGTWRRSQATLDVDPWRRFTTTERESIEAEAAILPIPGLDAGGEVVVRWA